MSCKTTKSVMYRCAVVLLILAAAAIDSATSADAPDEEAVMKKLEDKINSCADKIGLNEQQKKTTKEVIDNNRVSAEELKKMQEAPPDKQKEMFEAKGKKVEKEMRDALGEPNQVELTKCMIASM